MYPDFMEKTDRPAYESQSILGHLYRDIRLEEKIALEQFKSFDYDKSILLHYSLDQTIVKYARKNQALLQYLVPIYERIVQPMENRLKKLVIELNICSEAELFASNM